MAYGFEVYRPDGSTLISSKDGVARLMYGVKIVANFSGSISLPRFDSDLGFWVAVPYTTRWRRSAGDWYVVGNTESWSLTGGVEGQVIGFRPPVLSFNNTSKILSVSPNTETNQSISPATTHDRNVDNWVRFVHYR